MQQGGELSLDPQISEASQSIFRGPKKYFSGEKKIDNVSSFQIRFNTSQYSYFDREILIITKLMISMPGYVLQMSPKS